LLLKKKKERATQATRGLHEDRLETPSFVPVFDKESIDGNAMRTREREEKEKVKCQDRLLTNGHCI